MAVETGADLRREKAASLFECIGSRVASEDGSHANGPGVFLPLLAFDGLERLLAGGLILERPVLPERPQLPPELAGWVDPKALATAVCRFPELEETSVIPGVGGDGSPASHEVRFLSDYPGVRVARARFVDEVWAPWVLADAAAREGLARYSVLAGMHLRTTAMCDGYETVLAWGRANDVPVGLFHIDIVPGDPDGSIHVRLRTDKPCDPGVETILALGPDASDGLAGGFRSFIGSMQSAITDGCNPMCAVPEGLQSSGIALVPEPSVVLRAKPRTGLWRLGGVCSRAIMEGPLLPPAVLDLLVGCEGRSYGPTAPDFAVPMRVNASQREAISRMTTGRGSAVTAPRGSGATRTVVSAAVALSGLGKRVLVCVPGDSGVRECAALLPPGLSGVAAMDADGCGDDGKRLASLIIARETELRERFGRTPATVGPFVDKAAREYSSLGAAVSRDLSELSAHWSADGVSELAASEGEDGWLPFLPKPKEPCPLSAGEGAELYDLLRRYPDMPMGKSFRNLPPLGSLPTPDEFAARLAVLDGMGNVDGEGPDPSGDWIRDDAVTGELETAMSALSRAMELYGGLSASPNLWLRECAEDMFLGRRAKWAELWASTRRYVRELEAYPKRILNAGVTGMDGLDPEVVRNDALDLRNYLTTGGSLGFSVFRNRVVKDWMYIFQGVSMEGRACDTTGALEELLRWLDSQVLLKRLADYWRLYALVNQDTPIEQIGMYKERLALLDEAMNLDGARRTAMDLCSHLLAEGCVLPRDPGGCLASVSRAVRRSAMEEASGFLSDLGARTAGYPSLYGAVKVRDAEGYAMALQSYRDELERFTGLRRRDYLLSRLGGHRSGIVLECFNKWGCAKDPDTWLRRFGEIGKAWLWAREYGRLLEESGGEGVPEAGHRLAEGIPKESRAGLELSTSLSWTASRASDHPVRLAFASIRQIPGLIESGQYFDHVIVDGGHLLGPEGLFLHVLADAVTVFGDPWAVPQRPAATHPKPPSGLHVSGFLDTSPSYYHITAGILGVGARLSPVHAKGSGLAGMRSVVAGVGRVSTMPNVGRYPSLSVVGIALDENSGLVEAMAPIIAANAGMWASRGLTLGVSGLDRESETALIASLMGSVGFGTLNALGFVTLDERELPYVRRDIMVSAMPGTEAAVYSLAASTREQLVNIHTPAVVDLVESLGTFGMQSVYPDGSTEAMVSEGLGRFLSGMDYTVAEEGRSGDCPAFIRVLGAGGREGWIVLAGIGPFPREWLLDAYDTGVPILLIPPVLLALRADKAYGRIHDWLDANGIEPAGAPALACGVPSVRRQGRGRDMAGLLRLLTDKGYDSVDKRDDEGSLWVVGGRGLAPVMDEVRKAGMYFHFEPGGTRDTGFRPAWRMF